MLEDTPEGDGTVLLKGMIATMEETGSLYEALITSKVFPPYLCSMVEIGEQSGRLDDVMASLSEHYHREEEMARNIKSAVTYPLVMLGMMMVVIFVLIVKVLPVFNEVFRQLGTGLTGISGTILSLGNTISRYAALLVILAPACHSVSLLCFYSEGAPSDRLFCPFLFPHEKSDGKDRVLPVCKRNVSLSFQRTGYRSEPGNGFPACRTSSDPGED